LGKLDLVKLTPSSVAELVVAKLGPEGILLNRELRHRVFEAMSVMDGNRLLVHLGRTPLDQPLTNLLKINFSASSNKARALFEFFGCPIDIPDQNRPIEAVTIIAPQYPLFDHQRAALLKTLNFLLQPEHPRVLLHMPTGAGKTRTAMNVIANLMRSS